MLGLEKKRSIGGKPEAVSYIKNKNLTRAVNEYSGALNCTNKLSIYIFSGIVY